MRNCGIYEIKNLVNGCVYVGQSSNLSDRKYKHFYDLRVGIHDNSYLQRAYNKYGEHSFSFNVLIICEPNELDFYEQGIFDSLPDKSVSYNIHRESMKIARGVKRSEETKMKIGLKSLGNKNMLGKKHSPESIEKMRQAKVGHKHSDKTKNKMSLSHKGHPSYSNKLKGIPRTEEVKKKIGMKNKGHPVSDKQRQQISEYWAKRRLEKLMEGAS